MKQRINLYQPVLQPVPQRFALPALLSGCGVVILLLVAVTVQLQYQLQQLQQQTDKINAAVQLKTEELTNLQLALDNRQPAADLQKQAEQLNQELAQKQQLLQYLTVDQQASAPHYAEVMQQLSTLDLPQFWLRSFRLGQAGVEFVGVTQDAAAVPFWLKKLGQSPQFSGQQFSAVQLQPLPQNYLQFRVSSHVTTQGQEGAR